MNYSIQKRSFDLPEDEGVEAYIVVQHQHEEYERGETDLPSIVICECDTEEAAKFVLQALEIFSKKWKERECINEEH